MDKSVEDVDNPRKKNQKNGLLGIFAKQPQPGQVKTRLCPPLTAQQAADLYRCSLRETVSRMQQGNFAVTICYAGERDWFAENFPGLPLQPQVGDNLGARMGNAFASFLQQGLPAILIGSDSPDLPLPLVEQAFAALQQVEVVLAPAVDGGYVLIGQAQPHPQLFCDIPWSSAAVLPETLQRLEQAAIAYQQLPAWEDLDDFSTLQRLLQRSPQSATAAYLRQHLGELF